MRNPFQYGGVVGGPAFCNRTDEIAALLRAAENGEKLFIYSERRMGKTSLVLHALGTLSKHATPPLTSICGPATVPSPS
jgi:uncharacterized protein